jgi:hypothetical protein
MIVNELVLIKHSRIRALTGEASFKATSQQVVLHSSPARRHRGWRIAD